ncbi:hypothetical protein BKA65DRAFT_484714 [Rhexocercosporidium sp. MPI-PUGE-AT-0058]|nr:hypothetical protein BKA65DRAFT_484714 [Rhexocercosporidium sp. MPI-PUGE-AT-0058]
MTSILTITGILGTQPQVLSYPSPKLNAKHTFTIFRHHPRTTHIRLIKFAKSYEDHFELPYKQKLALDEQDEFMCAVEAMGKNLAKDKYAEECKKRAKEKRISAKGLRRREDINKMESERAQTWRDAVRTLVSKPGADKALDAAMGLDGDVLEDIIYGENLEVDDDDCNDDFVHIDFPADDEGCALDFPS